MMVLKGGHKELRHWNLFSKVEESFLKKVIAFHVFGTDEDDGGQSGLLVTDDTEVYGIGKNNYGQLGIGTREDTDEPCLISGLSGMKIQSISTGSGFVIVTVEDKNSNTKIYQWGRNDKYQLGIRVFANRRSPTLIDYFKGDQKMKVSCGKSHALVVTKDNKVVTWGSFDFAPDIEKKIVYKEPTELEKPKFVTKAACGPSFSMVATSNGEVFTRGLLHSSYLTLQLKLKVKLKKIVPGPKYFTLITSDGEVFTCQFTGITENVALKPVIYVEGVEVQPKTVDLITSWINDTIVAVTKEGVCYAWDKTMDPNPVKVDNAIHLFYNRPTPCLVRVFPDSDEDMPKKDTPSVIRDSDSRASSVDDVPSCDADDTIDGNALVIDGEKNIRRAETKSPPSDTEETRRHSIIKFTLAILLFPITIAFLFAVAKSNESWQSLVSNFQTNAREWINK